MSYFKGVYPQPVYYTPRSTAQYGSYSRTGTIPMVVYSGYTYPSGLGTTVVAPSPYSGSQATHWPSDPHARASKTGIHSSREDRRAYESHQTIHNKTRVKAGKSSTGHGVRRDHRSRSRSRSRVHASLQSRTVPVSGPSASRSARSRSRTRGRRSSTVGSHVEAVRTARDGTWYESSAGRHYRHESQRTRDDRRRSRSRDKKSSNTNEHSQRSQRTASKDKSSAVTVDRNDTTSTRTYNVKVGGKERVRIHVHTNPEPPVPKVQAIPPAPPPQGIPYPQSPFTYHHHRRAAAYSTQPHHAPQTTSPRQHSAASYTVKHHGASSYVSPNQARSAIPRPHPQDARSHTAPSQHSPVAPMLHIVHASPTSYSYAIALPTQGGVPMGSTFTSLPPIISRPCRKDTDGSPSAASDSVRSSSEADDLNHGSSRTATSYKVLGKANNHVPGSPSDGYRMPSVHPPGRPSPPRAAANLCAHPRSEARGRQRPPVTPVGDMPSIIYSPTPRTLGDHLEPISSGMMQPPVPNTSGAPGVPMIMLSSPTPVPRDGSQR